MKENLLENSENGDRLEYILSKKIGYGPGQQFYTRSIYLLLFVEGSQSIVLGLLLPMLTSEWDVSVSQKSLLITFVYLGVTIGSFLQTYSDHYGRLTFLLVDAILTTIFGILSCFCTSFYSFLIVRSFYGIGIGIILPLSATYITQICPGQSRVKILTKSRVYWSSGCVFACVVGWICLTGGHWRILLFILCLPNGIAIFDLYKNGAESVRYLFIRKDVKGVKKILDTMAQKNSTNKLSEQEIIDEMNKHKTGLFDSQNKKSFRDLFQPKYFKQTLILLYGWFTCCFIYYGVMLFLPSILNRQMQFSLNFQYIFLIVISIVQILSFLLSRVIIDHPFFGRKKSMVLIYFVVGTLSFLLMVFGEGNTIFLLGSFIILKILATSGFMVIYPYSTQIYETLIRSQALGVFSCMGRISTSILGLVGVRALQWLDGLGIYLIFVILSFKTSFLFYHMPYCTLGRQLDT